MPPSYFLVQHAEQLSEHYTLKGFAQRWHISDPDVTIQGALRHGWQAPTTVYRDILSFGPQLIHQHWATWSSPAVQASKKLDVPLIVSVHGYDAFLPKRNGILQQVVRRVKQFERHRALTQARRIVVNSRYMKARVDALRRDSHTTVVIPHGIDTEIFAPLPGVERRGLLFVGRLSPEKGCDILLRALSILPTQLYDSLTVIGDGPDRAYVQRLAAELGINAGFLGKLNHHAVIAAMQRAKVVVVPSVSWNGQQEASGIVPLEAQACGTLVVAAKTGGLPENITPELRTCLTARGTPSGIADAIRRAMEMASSDASEAVRTWIVDERSYAQMRAGYEQLYAEALTNS